MYEEEGELLLLNGEIYVKIRVFMVICYRCLLLIFTTERGIATVRSSAVVNIDGVSFYGVTIHGVNIDGVNGHKYTDLGMAFSSI